MKNLFKIFGMAILFLALAMSFNNRKHIIVIDAGHGGNDNGAEKGNTVEKEIVLSIAKKIKEFNSKEEIEIVLTRESNKTLSLKERTEMINKLNPDMVISLHMNNTPQKTENRGVEIYTQENEISKKFAEKLASKFDDAKIGQQNLHLLKETKAPTLLIELGFISNEEDLAYYSSEDGQTETARKILAFIYGF